MSLSPSPEADFTTTTALAEAKRSVRTPVSSGSNSPRKEQVSKTVNITIPPSPFITPRNNDDDTEHEQALKLTTTYNGPTSTQSRPYEQDDFTDFVIQSPEDVTLGELEDLLGF